MECGDCSAGEQVSRAEEGGGAHAGDRCSSCYGHVAVASAHLTRLDSTERCANGGRSVWRSQRLIASSCSAVSAAHCVGGHHLSMRTVLV